MSLFNEEDFKKALYENKSIKARIAIVTKLANAKISEQIKRLEDMLAMIHIDDDDKIAIETRERVEKQIKDLKEKADQ